MVMNQCIRLALALKEFSDKYPQRSVLQASLGIVGTIGNVLSVNIFIFVFYIIYILFIRDLRLYY
jgi:hypothetical protein